MHKADQIAPEDNVIRFIQEAHLALTDLGLRNKMISLPAASRGRSMDFDIDPEALLALLTQEDAVLKIGEGHLSLTRNSARPAGELRRGIISLIADAEAIASEQGINVLRLALGVIQWKDADNTIRSAPLFTMPVSISPDFIISPDGPLEANDTFPLFAASVGCNLSIQSDRPLAQALSVRAHSVNPIKPGSIAVLGYHPRVNLNLYAGKMAAMHRMLDLTVRQDLSTIGAIRALAGAPISQPGAAPQLPNVHVVQADTSQDRAITMARRGESFVLQGPPGTGKSQTIVNIVANLLLDGKRVIVSAEKAAALNVIAERWPTKAGAKHLPTPVILSEKGDPLPADAQLAIATPAVAALKIPPVTTFDVLIVDEASQIRLSHAIATASLARQVIVIGDSQQMSPSNMFSRASRSVTSDTMIKSLLDHAEAISLPSTMLTHHYRSKHDSLISFSNSRFYGERLDIIPSPFKDHDIGMSFRFVPNAIYDRGGNGDNAIEALQTIETAVALAKENARRYRTPNANPPRSLGIITLNEAQRDLILDTLSAALVAEGLSEEHLSGRNRHDRFFVKALENVQGDERDIIYVSMTYGPDTSNRFIANLGLLSQAGGAKRVNVLMTRAKWQTMIFHSFSWEQLATSLNDGAETLYACYRRHGARRRPMTKAPTDAAAQTDDPLHSIYVKIGQRLRGERFTIERFSRFIAGRRTDNPNHFVAAFYVTGLLNPLDEAADIARLKDMGWNLYKIHIDKWNADPDHMANKVYTALNEASGFKISL